MFSQIAKYLSKSASDHFAWISVANKYHADNIIDEPHYGVPGLILLPPEQAREIWYRIRKPLRSSLEYEVHEWYTFRQYQHLADAVSLALEPFWGEQFIQQFDELFARHQQALNDLYQRTAEKLAHLMIPDKDRNILMDAVKTYIDESAGDHAIPSTSPEQKMFLATKYYVRTFSMVMRHKPEEPQL
jgi:hypothetical protein